MTSTLERAVKLNESRKLSVKQKHRAVNGVTVSSCLLLCAALAACAGKITPSVSDNLAEDIENNFNGSGGSAATGNAGAAGSAATGNGGRAGSSNAAGAAGAGDDDPAAAPIDGAAGSSMAGGAGASSDPDEGGAGASGDPDAVGAETCNGFAILAANCGSSGCHGAGSNLGTFAASEEDAREYIGQPGGVCSSQGSIIDTEDPASSLMVTKLSDDPPCAQPMPLGGQPLPQADIDCIEDWISGL
jgi:hypothetical protein